MLTLTHPQIDQLKRVGRQYGLLFLVAFGSQVSGKAHAGSDLDIGYLPEKRSLSYRRRYELETRLKRIFPKQLIDLVDLRNCSPLLQHRAMFGGQLLIEVTPHSFAQFQILAYLNYVETKPLRVLQGKTLTKMI